MGGTGSVTVWRIVPWLILVAGSLLGFAFVLGLLRLVWLAPPGFVAIVREHFAALVCVPGAALAAMFAVVVLQQVAGPIEFEGWGFKFKGSSGQVVLWVICFLVLAAGIDLLW